MNNLPYFVHRDVNLAPTLHKLRSAGKKLFLLTNSRAAYTDRMMTYLLGGAMSEYPKWQNFFDIVIVAATKPVFFTERRPLLERDGETTRPAVPPLERGKVYEGGNLADVERALDAAGDEVLYVGDHIYGDILRSKKDSAWRTVMIMQELETEIAAHESCKVDSRAIESLEDQREHLEDDLRYYQARIKELTRHIEHATGARGRDASTRDLAALAALTPPKPAAAAAAGASASGDGSRSEMEADRMRFKRAVERIRGKLRHIDAEVTAMERRIDLRFHPYWGSLLKEGNEQSSFGKQVDEYACLYTSRVSNFLAYSPQQTFRSPRDVMAHEIGM
jgi:hypothetical protein